MVNQEMLGGLPVNRCASCRAWSRGTDMVRHSKRCSTPKAQAAPAVATGLDGMTIGQVRRQAREGSLGDALAFESYQHGLISQDQAMNQDF